MNASLRALIVEDSPADAELLQLELTRSGFDAVCRRVDSAGLMQSALEDESWDIVLSDYSLPGFGAARALALSRQKDPDLPFVVVSGTIGEDQAVEMMRAGANDYLLKGKLARLAPVIERELRESENRRALRSTEETAAHLAALVESSGDAIISETMQGVIVSWNTAAEQLLGWTSAEALGKHASFYAPPNRQDESAAISARIRSGERFDQLETVRLHKDGTLREVSMTVSPIRDREGRLSGISKVVRNITARKLAEEALRKSEERYRQVVEDQAELVCRFRRDGTITFANNVYCRMFGKSADELIGQPWQPVAHPDDLQMIEEKLSRITSANPITTIENRVFDASGRMRWMEFANCGFFDGGGQLIEIQTVARDITDRKRAEQELRESEQRYRTLVAATTAIVWDSPASGKFDSEQPSWTAFTGQSLEQHRGWGWLAVIHPDDRELSARAWAAAVAERSKYTVEHRLRRKDGVYRQMSVRAVPIFEPDGAIREWVGVHTDVTEQRRVEAERAELLARLTIQIERMPLAYLLSGPDFRFSHWNSAAELMFGFSATEVVGKHPFATIVPEQSQAIVSEVFSRLTAGDMNAHGICENVTKDGKTIICEWHNTPLFGLDGAFQGIFSLAQDITKREHAEQAVRDTQQRLKHILASSPAVLFTLRMVDETIAGISWVSANLNEVLGYAPEDTLGKDWWRGNIHREEEIVVVTRTHDELLGTGKSTNEYRFRHCDGRYIWIRSEIRLIRGETGEPAEAVGAWTDITARKLLEDQFNQVQKMDAFGQLAGGVAHDFNNLLTIINGYSDLLLQKMPIADPSREMMVEIRKAGERSAGLTRQLLAFSRKQVLTTRILDLNEVVADTDKMLRRLIGEDVQLTTTLASQLWAVRVDAGQIEQVLLNLAVNARDAMPKGGRLTIETRNVELSDAYVETHRDAHPGPHVLLSVSDTGSGMSREVLAKIFEPFFTTKAPGKGTGLGLATVYGIVKQSGGYVDVFSEIGVGTSFDMYLPRAVQADKDLAISPRTITPPCGTETVLLAEDEDGVRELTSRVLATCGYKLLQAANGEDAILMASAFDGPIHLLITDVVMPGPGGRAVAEELARQRPSIRVLFMSGYTDDAVIRHGVLREEMAFLQKPFTPFALASKVREVLDAPAV